MDSQEQGVPPSGSGSQASPGAAEASPPSVSIPNADEVAAIAAWLRRRADICYEVMPPGWKWRERRRLKTMAGTFNSAAILIERGVHRATSLTQETEIIAAALRRDSDTRPKDGDGKQAPLASSAGRQASPEQGMSPPKEPRS